MKTLVLILITLLLSSVLISQDNPEMIKVDFLTKQGFHIAQKAKHNSSLGIKFYNINKNLYKIKSDSKSQTFNLGNSDLFTKILSNNTKDKPILEGIEERVDGFAGAVQKINSQSDQKLTLDNSIPSMSKKIGDFDNQISDVISLFKRIQDLSFLNGDITDIANICDVQYEEIENSFREHISSFLTSDHLHLNKYTSNADLENAGENNLVVNRQILKKYSNSVVSRYESELEELQSIEEFIKSSTKAISDLKDKALSLPISAQSASDGIGNAIAIESRDLLIKLLKDQLSKLKELENRYDKLVKRNLTSLVESFKKVGIPQLMKSYDLINESNFTYYVSPVLISEDEHTLTTNFTPKDSSLCNIQAQNYIVQVLSIGGLKIDFSPGIFFNFGGNDFLDQTYSYNPVNANSNEDSSQDSLVSISQNTNNNILLPTIGALMHIYTRNGKRIQPSLTFGISTANATNYNYHLGGSLIIGHNRRFIFSAGLTLRQSEILDSNYELDKPILRSKAPDAIPTKGNHRLGYFLGISYNLN